MGGRECQEHASRARARAEKTFASRRGAGGAPEWSVSKRLNASRISSICSSERPCFLRLPAPARRSAILLVCVRAGANVVGQARLTNDRTPSSSRGLRAQLNQRRGASAGQPSTRFGASSGGRGPPAGLRSRVWCVFRYGFPLSARAGRSAVEHPSQSEGCSTDVGRSDAPGFLDRSTHPVPVALGAHTTRGYG